MAGNITLGKQVGTHVLINVYDVPELACLEYLVDGRPLLDRIVNELDLHVVAQTGHQFTPKGYSYAYVLSESHCTIHTYPEYQSCYIDIFCCNPEFSPQKAVDLVMREFKTSNVRHQVVGR